MNYENQHLSGSPVPTQKDDNHKYYQDGGKSTVGPARVRQQSLPYKPSGLLLGYLPHMFRISTKHIQDIYHTSELAR